ncbi:hypothetical protein DPMN_163062 [Dreissena polymorpha]|uniref:Uncharacterized protein n=1 Tax=Dreissena polymorpha TaxID=45954 RepID=A0A9D4IU35_DREPO|nr:hypothetical protein DPMN_163062 [Dreissena polymorpha]
MIGGNWCFESGDKIETTFVGLKTMNHTVGINISNNGLIKIQIDDDALPQYRNSSIDPADTRSIRVASDVDARLYSIEFLEL